MRPTLTIVVLLTLQGLAFAQLLSSVDDRQLPGEFQRTSEIPTELTGKASLRFVELSVIFDGGSYGALFRRDDSHDLVIYFLHPGYWTKEAIENKTQPIVVDLNNQDEDDVQLEVERGSPFEKRLIELLNDDLSNRKRSRKQLTTLTRVRDRIRERRPLREIRRRFRTAFKDS